MGITLHGYCGMMQQETAAAARLTQRVNFPSSAAFKSAGTVEPRETGGVNSLRLALRGAATISKENVRARKQSHCLRDADRAQHLPPLRSREKAAPRQARNAGLPPRHRGSSRAHRGRAGGRKDERVRLLQ